jgi:hypothetical protein
VALQVDDALPGQIAEVGGVVGDHTRQVGAILDVAVQAVGLAGGMDRGARLPVREVDLQVFVHGGSRGATACRR